MAAFLLIGCSSSDATSVNAVPTLVVGKSLKSLELNDQHEKAHKLAADTATVIFAFSKDGAHTCNDYLQTKDASYLADNNAAFIADVSAAPSFIRAMFIMPGLKDFKHTVLVLDDETIAAPFRAGMDTEKIVVVNLENGTITDIQTITTQVELIKVIETK